MKQYNFINFHKESNNSKQRMDDSESLEDLELDVPPKLTFDEVKTQIFREPGLIKEKKELLKAMYYYCKDTKKHSRIIKFLFWPMIISFVQEQNNNKISLFGLRLLNALIQNEATHQQILQMGQLSQLGENHSLFQQTLKEANLEIDGSQQDKNLYVERMKEIIRQAQNPIKILVKKIINTDSTLIMNEATKALKVFSTREDVIHQLWSDGALLDILHSKFEAGADPLSQENFLETLAQACKYPQYRKELVAHDDVIDILIQQIKSMSPRVTLEALKILRLLAKDFENLEKLQAGKKLRLSNQLIYTFRWLDNKHYEENQFFDGGTAASGVQDKLADASKDSDRLEEPVATSNQELVMIYREISKTFQYILLHYDLLQKLMTKTNIIEEDNLGLIGGTADNGQGAIDIITENELIETLISLGRATSDTKTMLNAATSLAHMTEVLHCNETVASAEAIEFMMSMLKDTKNVKNHRQGCRYFANLSYYSNYIDLLIDCKITAYMLGAIEADTAMNDEDTIKYSVIALANLSSHPNFMTDTQRAAKGDITQMSKVDRGKIKPLIHLLDSAKEGKINIIQSACITLCNMAAKTSLHQHFVEEPELSTLKNCFHSCIHFKNKLGLTNLLRFMLKLVCNLAKNPQIVPFLSKKGFLEILFELLNQERERELFGNIVTAIAYLSVQPDCRDRIIRQDIIPRIISPLNQLPEVDQKLVMISITVMLFNGLEIQREFIKNKGIDALLHFLRKRDVMYQQLSCKCFSLLSENQEFLQAILDYDCLNIIIIQCLKGSKEILDLDTIRELLKIFINLVLWRKIKRDMIQIACYVCDIGLMVNDQDINMMSVFCLSLLSENHKSHPFIFRTTNPPPRPGTADLEQTIAIQDFQKQPLEDEDEQEQESYGIFSRFNYLLESYDPYDLQGHANPQAYFQNMIMNLSSLALAEQNKKELMMNLITQTYLNLARNDHNADKLLSLQLFSKIKTLVDKYLMHEHLLKEMAEGASSSLFSGTRNPIATGFNLETSMVCYANSIFSRLLKHEQAKQQCLSENGHTVFVNILQRPQFYQHLFLETLDSLKYFLTDKRFLQHFAEITRCISFTDNLQDEINLSYLQIAALLSFDRRNHRVMKESGLLRKILRSGMFKTVLQTLKNERLFGRLNNQRSTFYDKPWLSHGGGATPMQQNLLDDMDDDDMPKDGGRYSSPGLKSTKDVKPNRQKSINQRQNDRNNEITLAITVLLANISVDQDFIAELMGEKLPTHNLVPTIHIRKQETPLKSGLRVANSEGAELSYWDHHEKQEEEKAWARIDERIRSTGVHRVTKLLNLVSSRNPEIAEQIAIILANVTSSGDKAFKHEFISDLCMKTLVKVINKPTSDPERYQESGATDNTLLAVLLSVMNFTASEQTEIVRGMEFMGFKESLEGIIQNQDLPLVVKSVSLMAISNLFSNHSRGRPPPDIKQETKDFALLVVSQWQILQSAGEHPELVRNLIYSSLVLFYNLIFLRDSVSPELAITTPEVESFINILTTNVIPAFGDDVLVSRVILDFVALLTKDADTTALTLPNEVLIDYCFRKLTQPTIRVIDWPEFLGESEQVREMPEPRLIKLASYALVCIAIKIDIDTCGVFNRKLKEMNNLDGVLGGIRDLCGEGDDEARMNDVLHPFLSFIETITTLTLTKDFIDCNRVYYSVVELMNDKINLMNRSSLVNIVFNLNFKLTEQRSISQEFIRQLYRTYQDYEKKEELAALSIDDTQKINVQRKIIALAVSCSARPDSHRHLIETGFYTQFKHNINLTHPRLVDASHDNELYGLLNIALNSKYLHLIWKDLRKIYKMVFKNKDIVEFRTKVDLFLACAKYISRVQENSGDRRQTSQFEVTKKSNRLPPISEETEKRQLEFSLKSLVYCLTHLIKKLMNKGTDSNSGRTESTTNYASVKYFLIAVQEATQLLQKSLAIFLRLNNFFELLYQVLFLDGEFKTLHDQGESPLKDFDDCVLNHSLKAIACEILFNLRNEPTFFSQERLPQCMTLIVKYALKSFHTNYLEAKQRLVQHTLRLISQMVHFLQDDPDAHRKILSTGAFDLVRDALNVTKDSKPGINLDAMLCMSNLMNLQGIALEPSVKQVQTESLFNNFCVMYFAYNQQIEMDECTISYLYALAQHKDYHPLIQEKLDLILYLIDRQVTGSQNVGNGTATSIESMSDALMQTMQVGHVCDSCRKRIFSVLYQLTDSNEEICKLVDTYSVVDVMTKTLMQTHRKSYSGDHIHEYGLKILINLMVAKPESFDDIPNIKELLNQIALSYSEFKTLARQYTIRLIYLLSKSWSIDKLENHLEQLLALLAQLIAQCEHQVDMKFVHHILERLSDSKKILLAFATKHSEQLMTSIRDFLMKNLTKDDQEHSIDGLIRFVKRLSKFEACHQEIVDKRIHEHMLLFVTKPYYIEVIKRLDQLVPSPENEREVVRVFQSLQGAVKIVMNLLAGNQMLPHIKAEFELNLRGEVLEVLCPALEQIYFQNSSFKMSELMKSFNQRICVSVMGILIDCSQIFETLDKPKFQQWLSYFVSLLKHTLNTSSGLHQSIDSVQTGTATHGGKRQETAELLVEGTPTDEMVINESGNPSPEKKQQLGITLANNASTQNGQQEDKYSLLWFVKNQILYMDFLLSRSYSLLTPAFAHSIFKNLIEGLALLTDKRKQSTKQKQQILFPGFWIKILKIISSLDYLYDYLTEETPFEHIEEVFRFVDFAHQKCSGEGLATYYFLRIIADLISKLDNNPLYLASEAYREIFHSSLNMFHEKAQNDKNAGDPLTLEIVLMLIEYFTFMSQFTVTYEAFLQSHIIKLFILCLHVHDHPLIVRAAAGALKECANHPPLVNHLLTDDSLSIILSQIILHASILDPQTLINLQECLRLIINNQGTTINQKYKIAGFGMEIAQQLFNQTPRDVSLDQQLQYFDNNVQFLHIHCYRLLFQEPMNPSSPQTYSLIMNLIQHDQSVEFNKLGLLALKSISTTIAQAPDGMFFDHMNIFLQEDIIQCLFAKYINITSEQFKRSFAKKLRQLAIEIAVNILDLAQAISEKSPAKEKQMLELQQRIYLNNGLLDIMVGTTLNIEVAGHQLDVEEIRLMSRAFAFMPYSIMSIVNPVTLNKPIKRAGEDILLTVENYLKAIWNIVNLFANSEVEQDMQTQYFALYALFIFIHEAQKRTTQANQGQTLKQDSLSPRVGMQGSKMDLVSQGSLGSSPLSAGENRLSNITLSQLSICLVKTQVIYIVMSLPLRSISQDVIRICIKILVEIIGYQTRLLFAKDVSKNLYDASIPHSMIPRLEKERESNRNQLLELLESLHALEIGSPLEANMHLTTDYAHHMHLLSNLIYTSLTSNVQLDLVPVANAGSHLLPPVGNLTDILIKTSLQIQQLQMVPIKLPAQTTTEKSEFDPEAKMKLIENLDKDNAAALHSNRMFLYKCFFFNFLISAALAEILTISKLQNGGAQYQVIHEAIFNALAHIAIQLGQSKDTNDLLDCSLLRDMLQESNSVNSGNVKQSSQEADSAGTVKEQTQARMKELQEAGESTCVALIRMLSTNMLRVVTDEFKQRQMSSSSKDGAAAHVNSAHTKASQQQQLKLILSQPLFENLLCLLTSYEDYEDVVEGVYDLLHVFIQISQSTQQQSAKLQQQPPSKYLTVEAASDAGSTAKANTNSQSAIKMMESSKVVVTTAIRHASLYQCQNAYQFLVDLFKASEKYSKDRQMLENALQTIKPPKSKRK